MATDGDSATRPGSRTDLWYARGTTNPDPVLVFQHLRKTGGTSLKWLLHRELDDREYRAVWAQHDQAHPPGFDTATWYERFWAAQSATDRQRLHCIGSHSAAWLLPHLQRPTVTVTLVREPGERVLSRYWMVRSKAAPADGKSSTPEAFMARHSLAHVYRRFSESSPTASTTHAQFAQFFNGQARALLDPHLDTSALPFTAGPPDDAQRWRARLEETLARYDIIGVTERHADFVTAVGARLGWGLSLTDATRRT